MTPAARSVRLFGIYLLLLGVALLVAPNVLLTSFGLAPTEEVWIRVVGMVTAFLGVYYRVAAAAELRPLFYATVLLRASVPVFFLIFVLAGWVGSTLLLFGIVDLVGALWTWTALKQSGAAA
jgi:hypothetical protein